jgi:hypothetical protein
MGKNQQLLLLMLLAKSPADNLESRCHDGGLAQNPAAAAACNFSLTLLKRCCRHGALEQELLLLMLLSNLPIDAIETQLPLWGLGPEYVVLLILLVSFPIDCHDTQLPWMWGLCRSSSKPR